MKKFSMLVLFFYILTAFFPTLAQAQHTTTSLSITEIQLQQAIEEYYKWVEEYNKKQEKSKKQLLEKENSKTVYLTFDDGPNEYTPQILNILKEENIKATFFVLKNHVDKNPDLISRMFTEGHSIGLHGITHDKDKIYQSPQTVVQEMELSNNSIEKITGKRTSLIRVPYGSKPWMPKNYRDAVVEKGYKLWDWNVDSKDSSKPYVSPDEIVKNTLEQVKKIKTPIILFHDRRSTVEALPEIISYLKQNQYNFKILEEHMSPVNFWGDTR